MPYNTLNQAVVSSLTFNQLDFDSFFDPVTHGHNGYAFDGQLYVNGTVSGVSKASWFTEVPGEFRGSSPSFPLEGLVLLGVASISIYDTTGDTLNLWMVFLAGDTLAFPNNPGTSTLSYHPARVTWSNGVLTVVYLPDPGSSAQTGASVTMDFVRDSVYYDACVPFS